MILIKIKRSIFRRLLRYPQVYILTLREAHYAS